MENTSSSIHGLGPFGSKLIKVLEATNYEGLSMYTGSSKRNAELNFYETIEELKPFIDWFSDCITEENYLTKDELQLYNKLKNSGNLVPDEELDPLINSLYSGNSSELVVYDSGQSLELAKKELEALESLENLLLKNEKEEKKKATMNFDVDATIKSGVENLDKLNECMNKALKNYALSWEELKNCFSLKNEQKFFSIIDLKKEIDENLNFHFKNDFKEVKPTEGIITVTAEEYWIVFNKLSSLREEVINVAARTQGLSLFNSKLSKLKTELNSHHSFSSLNDFRLFICEENMKIKLHDTLFISLKEEVNCVASLKLYDREKVSTFLSDRLDRLNKLEYILMQEKLYIHALIFIKKRDKVIKDFQLEKLNETSNYIQQEFSKFQKRMDNMSNFLPKRQMFCDSHYKTMMVLLDINSLDLSSIDDGMAALDDNINRIKTIIDSELSSLELAVVKRLRSVYEQNNVLIDGPTREVYYQVFKKFLDPIETASKTIRAIENKISNISSELNEIKMNECLRKDCLWMKCLNSPEAFLTSLKNMEDFWLVLQKKNEDMMLGKNFY